MSAEIKMALYDARRRDGICTSCGREPAIINRDGKPECYCERCKPRKKLSKAGVLQWTPRKKMGKAEKRKHAHASQRRTYERRKAAGECVKCGRPRGADGTKTRCADCALKEKLQKK